MEILALRDLIKDDRGNYYTVIKSKKNALTNEITLVNSFIELSYRRLLFLNDKNFAEENKDYDHEFLGKMFSDSLKNSIEHLKKESVPGGIYLLDEVQQHYDVVFIANDEYSKNPRINV